MRALVVLVFVAACMGAEAPRANQRPASERSLSDYALLTDRNIFVRNRSAPRTRSPITTRPTSTPSPPRVTQVLTGVVLLNDEYVAFVEDRRTGRTAEVRVGDTVGSGKVVRIDLNELELERDGRTVRVELGRTLDGGLASESATAASTGGAGTSSSTGASTLSGEAASVAERMRLRRLQEQR